MASSEYKGVVFALVFIIGFSALLGAIPTGLQGSGVDPAQVNPVDPRILTGFDDEANYSKPDYSLAGVFYEYHYSLSQRDWIASYYDSDPPELRIGQKYTYFLWLFYVDYCEFILENGTNRGTSISMDDVMGDAEDGVARYSLIFESSGNDAGVYVLYWNVTAYPDPDDAWDADNLEIIHGVGISTMASNDVLSLMIGLMFFSLPEVPVLVNLFIAAPIWASFAFLIFWIVTRIVPFSGS